MEPHFIVEIAKTALVSGTFLVALTIVMLLRRRQPVADPKALADVAARLHRIEQAIDTIAIEVERVSEGQRFTSRMLAETER